MKFNLVKLAVIFALALTGCQRHYQTVNPDDQAVYSAITKKLYAKNEKGPSITSSIHRADEIKKGLKFARVQPSNFTAGKVYDFYIMRLNLQCLCLGEYIVNEEGIPVTVMHNQPITETDIFLGEFMKGEPVHFALVSKDRNESIVTSSTPYPIETNWKDDAHASASFVTPTVDTVLVVGNKFQPNEELYLVSESGDEKIPVEVNADADGEWRALIAPGVKGTYGGFSKLTIKRSKVLRFLMAIKR